MLMQAKSREAELEKEAVQARRAARARRSAMLPPPPGSRPRLAAALARLRPTIAGR